MAAATTAIVGGVLGAGQAVSGIIGKNKAQKRLDALEPNNLDTDPYADIGISTLGSDIIREEGQRTTAGLLDVAQSGGVRSVMGSIPRIQMLNNQFALDAAADIDNQIIRRDYAIADDKARVRGMKEQRYLGEVQGLGQAIQANRQDIWSGVRGFGGALMYAGRNGLFGGSEGGGNEVVIGE